MGTTRRKSGVLAAEVEPYRAWLFARGYSPGTVRILLRNVSHLGVWLQARGLPGSSIAEASVREMFAARRVAGRHAVPVEMGIGRLLAFLTERGLLVEQPCMVSPLERLVGDFRDWMIRERGLSAATVLRYANTGRRFLTEQALHDGVLDVAALRGCGRERVPAARVCPGFRRFGQGPSG